MPIPRFSASAAGADVAAGLAAEGCAIIERVVKPVISSIAGLKRACVFASATRTISPLVAT